ncbi:MAG: hypothetical protein NTW05_10595 [Pseudonocardiales bacterium]|nr:hypothetical protein [Pseudonocardiales bacterium]
MAYTGDGLRSGFARASTAGEAAHSATCHLLGAVIGRGAFGDVAGGESLVTGLDSTREAHARLGHDVAARDAYRPLDHTPADDPQTPLDDRELRHRIRYGHP